MNYKKKKRYSPSLEKQVIRLESQVSKTIRRLSNHGKTHFYISLVPLFPSSPHPSGEYDSYAVHPRLLMYDLPQLSKRRNHRPDLPELPLPPFLPYSLHHPPKQVYEGQPTVG